MAEQIGTLAFVEACHRILKDESANGYAKAYAQAGIDLFRREAPRKDLQVQAIYILSNITHWRGQNHLLVRNTLKNFSKG